MTGARDRAIDALCDTIDDLRNRIAVLEMVAREASPDPRWKNWVGGQATPQPKDPGTSN